MENLLINKREYHTFSAVAEKDGKLYIAARDNKALLEYDPHSKKTLIKNVILGENFRSNYWTAFSYEDEIWFLPLRDYQKIAVYNVLQNSIEFIAMPSSEHKCPYIPFMDYHIVGDCAYISPAHYDCLLKINLKTRDIFRINIDVEKYAGSGYPTISASFVYDNVIIFCPFNNKDLIVWDIEKETVIKKIHLNISKAYTNVFVHDNKIILVPYVIANGLLSIDIDSEEMKEICIECRDDLTDCKYEGSLVEGEKIVFIPKNGNTIVVYDYVASTIDYKQFEMKDEQRLLCFSKSRKLKDGWYALISEDSTTPCLLYHDGMVEIIDIELPDDYFITELLMEIEEREK